MARLTMILLLSLLWLPGRAESAADLRCGDDLILPGDRKIQVLQSCGEPVTVDRWEEVRNTGFVRYGVLWDSWEKVAVEEWTFNLGPRSFLYVVRFENGVVADIKTGDYGF